MEFTTQETKLVKRLRKEQRRWVWARWFFLAIGVASIVLCAVFGFTLHSLVSDQARVRLNEMSVFFIVLIWTKCCMYFGFAVYYLITTWARWHGDINRTLLLKLLDAQEHQPSSGLGQ